MTDKTKNPVSLWDSKNLLILIAAGQGAALIYASVSLDGHALGDPLLWLSIPRGLMGIATSFAASYSAYELPRVKSPKIQKIGSWALGVLIVSSAVVVSICTFGTPAGWFRVFASIAYSLLPEAAAVAVATASGRLFAGEQVGGQQPAAGEQQPKRKKKQVEQVVAVAEQIQAAAEPPQVVYKSKMAEPAECEFCHTSGTRGWVNGHRSHCKDNPVNQSVPVDWKR